ncbi:MAG: hypothetical protein L6Q97_16030 [Thermoanaerobaculia bacterium]|nr:hypothetical protein [Thermoanaerobaculia bacterium]
MVHEFQHKGYALLFGFVALVVTFIFWGIMPPFFWLSPAVIFFYLGIQFGKGKTPGRWIALILSLLPLWIVALALSWGKPGPYVHISLVLISLTAGAAGVWLAGRSAGRAEFVLHHVALPLAAGLLGMLGATLLMFVVSASGIWPWKEMPPFALLLPIVMGTCVIFANRIPGRLWWRDVLLIWAVPVLFFVIYRPFLMEPEPKEITRFETNNWWMAGATLAGLLLTLGLSRMTRNWRKN